MTKYQELEMDLADRVKRGCERHAGLAIEASHHMLEHYEIHLIPQLRAVRHRLRQEMARRANEDIPTPEAEDIALAEAEDKLDDLLGWIEDAPIQEYLYTKERK